MSHCAHLLLAPKGLVVVEKAESADESPLTVARAPPVSEAAKAGS
jgi:hypothetical protein